MKSLVAEDDEAEVLQSCHLILNRAKPELLYPEPFPSSRREQLSGAPSDRSSRWGGASGDLLRNQPGAANLEPL